MKIITSIIGLITLLNVNAQSQATLGYNNVGAKITDAGYFFHNSTLGSAAYAVPGVGNRNLIYASAFWFGGTDVNGQLKLAAQDMYNQGADLWPGALTADGTASVVTPNPLGQTLWGVSKYFVNEHIANFDQPGYIIPAQISNWPAHGDVTNNQSYHLAPFVDADLNGVYEPEMGDYPCIKGDMAYYTIMNDKGGVHYSGGEPLGIEVHFMFYQFAAADAIDNTTFVDVEVFNRSTNTIYNFATSFMMDGDLGNPNDDFVGVDQTRNLGYQYNGDDDDANIAGAEGYGVNPPSFGVMCLNESITGFNTLDITSSSPATALESYNFMRGLNLNASDILDNNSNPTKFRYYDNPNDASGWSEVTDGNIMGDRRSILTVMKDVLLPSESITYNYAIIVSRDGINNFDNVNALFETADFVQSFHDNNLLDQCDINLGIKENASLVFDIYPNPSNGTFSINPHGVLVNAIVVNDMTGREVYHETVNSNDSLDVQLNCYSGMYMVSIETNLGHFTKSIVLD